MARRESPASQLLIIALLAAIFKTKRLAAVNGAVGPPGDIYMSNCFVVIVPQDANPFIVERQQMVRLMQDGISGSKIVAEVDGPAEIVAENSLLTVKNSHVLLGKEQVEFVIRPAGKGKVKVKITATFLENKPTVTNYEFDVK